MHVFKSYVWLFWETQWSMDEHWVAWSVIIMEYI